MITDKILYEKNQETDWSLFIKSMCWLVKILVNYYNYIN